MPCEETYSAIIRYLTDEQESYAPGTSFETKKKIRKAAYTHVVRNGTLFYQRRLKGQDELAELEVVRQDSRKKELIKEAHIMEEGVHLSQQLTWEFISQKYWWIGIKKNVKEHIKACSHCKSRRKGDGAGPRESTQQGGRRANTNEEEEEEEADASLPFAGSSS